MPCALLWFLVSVLINPDVDINIAMEMKGAGVEMGQMERRGGMFQGGVRMKWVTPTRV